MNTEGVNNRPVFYFAGIARHNIAIGVNLVGIPQTNRIMVTSGGHVCFLKQLCSILNGKCITTADQGYQISLRKLCSEALSTLEIRISIISNCYTRRNSRTIYLNIFIDRQMLRGILYLKDKLASIFRFDRCIQQCLRHFNRYLIGHIIANTVIGCFHIFLATHRGTVFNLLFNIGARVSNGHLKVACCAAALSCHCAIRCNGNFLTFIAFYFKVMRGLIRDECLVLTNALLNKAVITCRKAIYSDFTITACCETKIATRVITSSCRSFRDLLPYLACFFCISEICGSKSVDFAICILSAHKLIQLECYTGKRCGIRAVADLSHFSQRNVTIAGPILRINMNIIEPVGLGIRCTHASHRNRNQEGLTRGSNLVRGLCFHYQVQA